MKILKYPFVCFMVGILSCSTNSDLNSEFNYTLKSDSILQYLTLVPLGGNGNGEIILVGEK